MIDDQVFDGPSLSFGNRELLRQLLYNYASEVLSLVALHMPSGTDMGKFPSTEDLKINIGGTEAVAGTN